MNRFASPVELMKWHDEQAALISSAEYIRSPRHQRLKDVWCAARFGLGYERFVRRTCRLRVTDTQGSDADFLLSVEGSEFRFQTTIADAPERRMGDDYRPRKDEAPYLMQYEPERHRQEGPSWIAAAVDRKIAKRYSGVETLNLLVYANFSTALRHADVICNALRSDQRIFNSIWVLTNHQLCSIYSTAALGCLESWGQISDLEL